MANVGDLVTFPRTDTQVCTNVGAYLGTNTWTQEGVILEVLPSGRLRVKWDDPVWGTTQMHCFSEEIQILDLQDAS